MKYYIPKLQHRTSFWREQLPTLKKNSQYRIANNKNYQYYIKGGQDITEDSDDDVNVVDLVQIIHEVLSNYYNFDDKQFWAGDLDYSNELNVLDLTKLTEFILIH